MPEQRITRGISNPDFFGSYFESRQRKEEEKIRAVQLENAKLEQSRQRIGLETDKREQRRSAESAPEAGRAIAEMLAEVKTIDNLLSNGDVKEALQVTGNRALKMFNAGADITEMKRFGRLIQKDSIEAGNYLRNEIEPKLKEAMIKFQKEAQIIPNSAIRDDREGNQVIDTIGADGRPARTILGQGPRPDEPDTFSTVQLADGRSVQINNRTGQESTSPRTPPPAADGGEGVRGQKIADLMAQLNPQTGQNFTRAEAANRVDGMVTVEQNPGGGGAPRIIDNVNLTANEIPSGRERTEPPGPPEGQSIFSQIRKGTGLMSGISAGVSIAGGQFGLPVNPEVLQARDTLSAALNPLIEALQITDRMGSQEVARIGKMGNLDPGLFKSPEAMEAQAIGLDRRLRVDLAQALAEVDNPDLPDKARQAASDDATAIQNFLVKLDVPDDIYASVLTIETIPTLDIDDLRRLRTTITDEELDAMPEDVWNAYKSRLRSGK